jgi:hypothetical protein
MSELTRPEEAPQPEPGRAQNAPPAQATPPQDDKRPEAGASPDLPMSSPD